MNHHLQVQNEARKQGRDLATLTENEYFVLAMRVRTSRQKVVDTGKVVANKVRTSFLGWVVPAEVLEERKRICRTNECGSYGHLSADTEVCHACNCSGKRLASKLSDPNESCPLTPPRWGRFVSCTVGGS